MADATDKGNDAKGAEAPVVRRSRNPLQFFSEVRRELSKVTWPTWKETYLTTIMVFIMVVITMVFFLGVDTVLAYASAKLWGV